MIIFRNLCISLRSVVRMCAHNSEPKILKTKKWDLEEIEKTITEDEVYDCIDLIRSRMCNT